MAVRRLLALHHALRPRNGLHGLCPTADPRGSLGLYPPRLPRLLSYRAIVGQVCGLGRAAPPRGPRAAKRMGVRWLRDYALFGAGGSLRRWRWIPRLEVGGRNRNSLVPVVLLFSQAPNKHGNGLALPVGRRCFSFHPGNRRGAAQSESAAEPLFPAWERASYADGVPAPRTDGMPPSPARQQLLPEFRAAAVPWDARNAVSIAPPPWPADFAHAVARDA